MKKHLALTVLLVLTGVSATTWADPDGEAQLKATQDHLLKMHDLSTRILASKEPQQRERLKAEQRELMRAFDQAHQHLVKNHLDNIRKSQPAPK